MRIERIVARGMSLLGLDDSPASWIACSKPSSENTMPLPGMASSTDLKPNGMKPPPAVKLPPWKLLIDSTRMASSGAPTFHQVATVLTRASIRMPRKLMETKIAISTTAITIPGPVRTLVPPLTCIQLSAQCQCCAYWIMASTSTGATEAACSQENQPNEAPAAPPKE
jgi:hypothetical protein